MYQAQIDELSALRAMAAEAEARLKDFTAALSAPRGLPINELRSAGPIAGETYSVFEAVVEARQAVRAISNPKLKKGSLVRRKSFSIWKTHVDAIAAVSSQLSVLVEQVAREERPVAFVNNATFTLADSGQVISDFSEPARALIAAVDAIASDPLAFAITTNSTDAHLESELALSDLAGAKEALASLNEVLGDAKSRESEIQSVLSAVTELRTNMTETLNDLESRLSAKVEEAEAAAENIQSTESSVGSNAAVVSSKLDDITKWSAQSQETYAEIAKFGSGLDSVKQRLKDAEGRAARVVQEIEAQKGFVDDLILSADQMLRGSTVAGLATAFDQERKVLDQRMRDSLWLFGIGIFLIIAGTGLLSLYVFQIKTDIPIPGFEGDASITLSGFLARAILLLGPVWLTLFSTRRYRRLFDLRQQYSHKYAMAFSVDGFQRQAPTYKEQIAYWVFQTIGQPPLLGKEGRQMDEHPATTLKELLDALVERFPFGLKKSESAAD